MDGEAVRQVKRKGDPSLWKRNIAKQARKSGLPYINTKGNPVPAKQVGPNTCKCSRKCITSLSSHQQTEILQRLQLLNTKDEQDVFLQNLIMRNSKRKRRPEEEQRVIRLSYTYNVLLGQETREVCRNAFLSLYSISLKRVKRMNKLAFMGVSPKDMRGKARSANTLPSETVLKMHSHIQSFPTETSHYTGSVINYLDERLDIKTMWNMYKEKHPESPVGYISYYNYFKENFNLKFGQPQVDCCCECEMLTTKIKNSHISEAARRNAEADLMVHKRRAKKFYSKLKEEKEQIREEGNVAAIAFDFMQNLTVPKIPVQDTFYLRQVTVNVFAVHNLKKNSVKLYIYHEGDGRKGPNEVCSFLLDYFSTEIPKSVKTLHLYSDNCGGQNKNHALTKMLLALVQTKRFDRIEQYYPMRGHSFLPCDRDFAQVKKALARLDRIYSIRQLIKVILSRRCSKNPRKFLIKLVHGNDIFDYKIWWPQFYKMNPVSVETKGKKAKKDQKVKFGISSFHHLHYNSSTPGVVVAYPFIDGLIKHTFSMRKPNDLQFPPTALAYPSGKVPLKQAKIDDVIKLQPYIPQKYMRFFNSLIHWPTTTDSEEKYLNEI